MNIYLASNFDLKAEVEVIAKYLEMMGHRITVKWWHRDFKKEFGGISNEEWYKLPDIESVCSRNFRGIDFADVVILVASLIEDEVQKFNGANIEVRYALGKGKRVLSIGMVERSAMYQQVEKYPHILDLVNKAEGF